MDIPRIIRAILGQPEPPQMPLKDFETEQELTDWCHAYWNFYAEEQDCDIYARDFRAIAEMDGHFLSLSLVADGRYYYTNDLLPAGSGGHMANMAVVTDEGTGGSCFYVDCLFKKIVKLTNMD